MNYEAPIQYMLDMALIKGEIVCACLSSPIKSGQIVALILAFDLPELSSSLSSLSSSTDSILGTEVVKWWEIRNFP